MNKNHDKLKEISPKHRQFAKKVIAGESAGDAAAMVGFSPQYGRELMCQDKIKSLLLREMEKAGISEGYLATKLREGLEATLAPKKDGGEKHPDYFVRGQYFDKAVRIRGDYAPEKVEHTRRVINITVTPDFIRGLVDAKAIDESEVNALEAEIVEDTP